jgi:Na+/melibiose symporter-like transporter
MGQFLEMFMLICFGCSWPMSLVKNIKCHSAKGMSLPFILLITTGYVAGISAKIANHQFNIVFIVYVLNILIVSANIVVYFINSRHDRKNKLSHNSAHNSDRCMA